MSNAHIDGFKVQYNMCEENNRGTSRTIIIMLTIILLCTTIVTVYGTICSKFLQNNFKSLHNH